MTREPRKRRQIWISEEVFAYLSSHSRPLVDTPDSTLKRLFSLGEFAAVEGRSFEDYDLSRITESDTPITLPNKPGTRDP